jgi:ribosomal protein S12
MDYQLLVETSENVIAFTFCVFSRGVLVRTRTVKNKQRSTIVTIPVRFILSPQFVVVAYYVRKDGEMVSDSMVIPCRSKLSNYVSIMQ